VTGETGKDLEGRLADALKHPQRYADATTRASSRNDDSDLVTTAEASVKRWLEDL
jgi:hypothetical protein